MCLLSSLNQCIHDDHLVHPSSLGHARLSSPNAMAPWHSPLILKAYGPAEPAKKFGRQWMLFLDRVEEQPAALFQIFIPLMTSFHGFGPCNG